MRHFYPILFSVILLSCSESEQVDFVQIDPVRLSEPQAGQKTYYVNYTSLCDNYSGSFEYGNDTLVIEVKNVEDSIYFEEFLTPLSYSVTTGASPDTLAYGIEVLSGSILIPDRWESRLFFFYGNDTIHFQKATSANLLQDGCRLEIDGDAFIGEEIGAVPRFQVGDYRLFNKRGVSCVPGFIGTFEAYLIYDHDELYVSETIISDVVTGWRRL